MLESCQCCVRRLPPPSLPGLSLSLSFLSLSLSERKNVVREEGDSFSLEGHVARIERQEDVARRGGAMLQIRGELPSPSSPSSSFLLPPPLLLLFLSSLSPLSLRAGGILSLSRRLGRRRRYIEKRSSSPPPPPPPPSLLLLPSLPLPSSSLSLQGGSGAVAVVRQHRGRETGSLLFLSTMMRIYKRGLHANICLPACT